MKTILKAKDMEEVLSKRQSPSSINSYFYCPRQYYQTYILGLRSPGSEHTVLGTTCHYACEKIFDQKFIDTLPNTEAEATPMIQEELQRLFDEEFRSEVNQRTWNDHVDKTDEAKAIMVRDYKYSLRLFGASIINDAHVVILKGKVKRFKTAFNRIKPMFREKWLECKELNIGGYIDSIQHVHNSDDVAVIDYKTSMREGDAFPPDYRRQVGIYAYLYKVEFGDYPKYVGIHYLLNNHTILLEVTDKLVADALEDIAYVRSELVANGTKMENYSDMCRFKSYKWIEYKYKQKLDETKYEVIE